MNKQTHPVIKWLLTLVMLIGAITTSLQLHTLTGLIFLLFGNISWTIILLRIREYAGATVFAIMGFGWSLGLIKYFLF